MIAHVLSIAGSDPSGGAGIAADLKTFAALGVYGMAVITALTVQNTCAVRAVQPVAPEWVGAQLDAVLDDVRVDAIKLGMLCDAGIMHAVTQRLVARPMRPVVCDPVMCASSGNALMTQEAVEAMRAILLPRVDVLTPNLHEAAVLLGTAPAQDLAQMREQAIALQHLGPRWVLLKGGHLDDHRSPDVLAGPRGLLVFDGPRLTNDNGHGTGCTLSAALAALLTTHAMEDAVAMAKRYVFAALKASDELVVGAGSGPLHHGYAFCAATVDKLRR